MAENKKQKPASVAIEEFKTALAGAINGCGLPPVIIEPILANVYNQVVIAAKQQLEAEQKAFEEEKEG